MQGDASMAEKQLTINQQLALLPATIPDSILDFLQDFQFSTVLQDESVIASFDPEYFRGAADKLRVEIDELRKSGKLMKLQVEACGRDIPGAFIAKLQFESGDRGLGIITKLKERTILKVIVQNAEYSEEKIKEILKNPPK